MKGLLLRDLEELLSYIKKFDIIESETFHIEGGFEDGIIQFYGHVPENKTSTDHRLTLVKQTWGFSVGGGSTIELFLGHVNPKLRFIEKKDRFCWIEYINKGEEGYENCIADVEGDDWKGYIIEPIKI